MHGARERQGAPASTPAADADSSEALGCGSALVMDEPSLVSTRARVFRACLHDVGLPTPPPSKVTAASNLRDPPLERACRVGPEEAGIFADCQYPQILGSHHRLRGMDPVSILLSPDRTSYPRPGSCQIC